MSINLSRNTRLWISTEDKDGVHTNANTFEIPVQDGYTLTQPVSSVDVSVEEAGPTPARGSRRFNNTLDPVDWAFTTYLTPFYDGSAHYVVDMLLWHALSNGNSAEVDLDNSTSGSTAYGDSDSFKVNFQNNSAHVLKELYLYFLVDNKMLYVDKIQVSQLEMTIDISDISQSSWSGQGLLYSTIPTPAFVSAGGYPFSEDAPEASGYAEVPATKKYLVNKLTVMSLESDMAPGGAPNDNYKIPITGGSITINNNVTYLTPTTLREVDKPIGSFTGAFEVMGTIEAYLRDNGGSTGSTALPYGTSDLLDHMRDNVDTAVQNSANLVFNIGGTTGARARITVPMAHLSVPDISVEDVVSTSIEFKGIGSSDELASGDEVSLEFFAD